MAKLTLTSVGSGIGAGNTINANNDLIEAALENTLSLDGTSPNAMSADLDLDSNDLLNVNDGQFTTITVGGVSLSGAQLTSLLALL